MQCITGKESDDGRSRAERCRQLFVCTECSLHTSCKEIQCNWLNEKGLASFALSDGTLFGHITGKSTMHVMLLMGIKVYLYGRVLLIDISDYTMDQLMQTTLDASELCTVTASYLRLTSTNC
ncbi:hypothetical protein EDC96DRAFT_570016 [Choanephora cucurbitarum]|nr:hypothetical protein EDC96DRAFT_570016 [Choanephora cucurbitarum]